MGGEGGIVRSEVMGEGGWVWMWGRVGGGRGVEGGGGGVGGGGGWSHKSSHNLASSAASLSELVEFFLGLACNYVQHESFMCDTTHNLRAVLTLHLCDTTHNLRAVLTFHLSCLQ